MPKRRSYVSAPFWINRAASTFLETLPWDYQGGVFFALAKGYPLDSVRTRRFLGSFYSPYLKSIVVNSSDTSFHCPRGATIEVLDSLHRAGVVS